MYCVSSVDLEWITDVYVLSDRVMQIFVITILYIFHKLLKKKKEKGKKNSHHSASSGEHDNSDMDWLWRW